LWLRLRPAIEALGDDVRVKPRERYAEFDRRGQEFVIAQVRLTSTEMEARPETLAASSRLWIVSVEDSLYG
jgi:hypothetical protein